MKRLLLVLLLSVLLLIPYQPDTDWTRIVPLLRASSLPMTCNLHGKAMCTAFSINEERGIFLTAKHCIDEYTSDEGQQEHSLLYHQPYTVLLSNEDLDIAILVSKRHARPALRPRRASLSVGEPVATYGYGYGLNQPTFRTSNISLLSTSKNPYATHLDNAIIPGMSGGPVVDSRGQLVGVNTQTNLVSGLATTIDHILQATTFWGR